MRFICPCFTDSLVGREAAKGFEATSEIVGGNKVSEMLPELIVRLVMVAFDGCLLDRPVHPFDLAIRPWMTWFGETMFDVEVCASRFECVAAERQALRPHRFDVVGCPAIAGRIGEMRSIVSEYDVDPVRYGRGEVAQEVASDPASGFLVQLYKGELGGSVDGDQQVELSLLGSHLSEIDVEVADWIRLELLPRWLVPIDLGQSADAMALEATVQRGARQMRDRRL
jgi:hypothetical protein